MNNTTTLFSTAFPHQAAALQNALPLMADAASRLYVCLIENDNIELFVTNQADYDLLIHGANWERFRKLFESEWPTSTRISLTLRLGVGESVQPELLPAAPTPRPSPKSNKLSLAQQMALGEWIKPRRHDVENEPDTKLAARAAVECGFPITSTNFSHVRTALQIEKAKPDVPPTTEERIKRLEMVLGTFITWSQQQLGESGSIALLKMLVEHPAKLSNDSQATAPETPAAPQA